MQSNKPELRKPTLSEEVLELTVSRLIADELIVGLCI